MYGITLDYLVVHYNYIFKSKLINNRSIICFADNYDDFIEGLKKYDLYDTYLSDKVNINNSNVQKFVQLKLF